MSDARPTRPAPRGRSLQQQLLGWISLVTLALCLIAAIVVFRQVASEERTRAETWMQATALQLAAGLERVSGGGALRPEDAQDAVERGYAAIGDELERRPGWPAVDEVLDAIGVVTVGDESTAMLIAVAPAGARQLGPVEATGELPSERTAEPAAEPVTASAAGLTIERGPRGGPRVLAPVRGPDGDVIAVVRVEARRAYFAAIWWEAAAEASILLVVGVALSVFTARTLARSLSRPTHAIAGAVRDLAAGKLETRVRLDSRSLEFNALADDFNGLAAQLDHAAAVRSQLEVAAAVQQQLLPPAEDVLAGVAYASEIRFSDRLGGDVFDVLERDGVVYVIVADVVGHGVGAALLASAVHAAFRAAVIERETDLAGAVEAVNRHLASRGGRGTFVTAFAAAIDAEAGRLDWCSAGHEAAYVVDPTGAAQTLAATGIPLGIAADARWPAERTPLSTDDTLLVVTDGIRERRDASGAFHGTARLERDVASLPGQPLAGAVRAIVAAAEAFAAPEPADDDCTVVAIRRASSDTDGLRLGPDAVRDAGPVGVPGAEPASPTP